MSYLCTSPEVDPSRIGCAGLSLGGEMTMWLAAMGIWVGRRKAAVTMQMNC
ncbi:MAG: hypothetical protein IT577_18050 [Verrucomicrobiae bacterium]|nr:hypothetical protein [Verrucomicrobiae bacterium]